MRLILADTVSFSFFVQVLDVIALNLPPERVYMPLVSLSEGYWIIVIVG